LAIAAFALITAALVAGSICTLLARTT